MTSNDNKTELDEIEDISGKSDVNLAHASKYSKIDDLAAPGSQDLKRRVHEQEMQVLYLQEKLYRSQLQNDQLRQRIQGQSVTHGRLEIGEQYDLLLQKKGQEIQAKMIKLRSWEHDLQKWERELDRERIREIDRQDRLQQNLNRLKELGVRVQMDDESVDPNFAAVDPSILTDQQRYEAYIQENGTKLEVGDWISFTDDAEPLIYHTYQEAATDNRHLPGWFCREYRGLCPEPYELDTIGIGRFELRGQSTKAAYIKVQVFNPSEHTEGLEMWMKIDTGADITYGITTEIDSLRIVVKKGKEEHSIASGVGGKVLIKHLDVDIEIEGLPRIPLKMACPVDPNVNTTKRLLGQSFLGLCRHTWTNQTEVKIEMLPPKTKKRREIDQKEAESTIDELKSNDMNKIELFLPSKSDRTLQVCDILPGLEAIQEPAIHKSAEVDQTRHLHTSSRKSVLEDRFSTADLKIQMNASHLLV